jgi:hypothetical protein
LSHSAENGQTSGILAESGQTSGTLGSHFCISTPLFEKNYFKCVFINVNIFFAEFFVATSEKNNIFFFFFFLLFYFF